jgi:hypothetical protein
MGNRFRRFIDSADLESAFQEVIEIAPAATPGIKHTHPGNEATLQQLIEQIDVEVAEPVIEI